MVVVVASMEADGMPSKLMNLLKLRYMSTLAKIPVYSGESQEVPVSTTV